MFGEFVWFTGVVEDRKDPEQMNRVRVRCFGYHDKNKSLIATEELPWATVMMPTTSSGMSGLQESPHGLVEGSWVVGFFRDGNDAQDPVVMGSIASKSVVAANTAEGFNDPSGTYPKTDYLDSADVNKHARAVDTTLVQNKKSSVTTGVTTASGGTWDEPQTPYNPEYPFNKVYESETGHLKEIDDTTGAERLHEYHKAGTFKEIHPDGSQVTRIVGNNYEVIAGDDFINVKGSVKLTIDADCDTYIKGDWNIKVDGDVVEEVGGNKTSTITKQHTLTAPNGSMTYDNGSIEVKSGNITDTQVTLNSHKHTQGIDGGMDTQQNTNSPIKGT